MERTPTTGSIRRRSTAGLKSKSWCKDHLSGPFGQKPEGPAATQVKTFKFHHDQIKTVQAAIDRAKEIAGAENDSAALEIICKDYVEGGATLSATT